MASHPRGSVAIITGASGGIGRALAIRLGAEGYRVGLIARRTEELGRAADEVRSAGGTAAIAVADVGDRSALRAAIGAIEGEIGPSRILVANAGIAEPTRLDPLNIEAVEAMVRVNLMGVIYAIEAVLPGMLARGSGQVVAISSLAAFKGLPGESAYCASKAAVNAYVEGLRIDSRGRGVTFTTVCPGFVRTGMTPMETPEPFLMTADAAARRVARAIARGRAGVVKFPWPTAAITALLARMPDGWVARLAPSGEGPPRKCR